MALGRESFNDQFLILEGLGCDIAGSQQAASASSAAGPCAAPAAVPQRVGAPLGASGASNGQTDLFGGLGREGYMQARVHRRLHPQAVFLLVTPDTQSQHPHPPILPTNNRELLL